MIQTTMIMMNNDNTRNNNVLGVEVNDDCGAAGIDVLLKLRHRVDLHNEAIGTVDMIWLNFLDFLCISQRRCGGELAGSGARERNGERTESQRLALEVRCVETVCSCGYDWSHAQCMAGGDETADFNHFCLLLLLFVVECDLHRNTHIYFRTHHR